MPMETAMSIEIMALLTIAAVLFVAGFASGPLVVRKLHPTPHDHLHSH
jgi:hypothetical protein